MRFDLAAMARRAKLRRRITTFAPIPMTSAFASALARISHRILAGWYDARPRIIDIYARELERRLQTDAIDDLASLFDELGKEVSRLILDLTPALQEWAFRVETWHRGKWADTVLAGTDVDISYLIGPQDAAEPIETFMARNTALIRNVGDETRSKVADIVYRGLQQRTPARTVGKLIGEATGLARKRANRIAADQATKLASALDGQRQREAGLDVFRYRHSGKLHPRSWHRARDGKLYERDTRREVEFVDGERKYGPDTIAEDDMPGGPPFCGCTTQGVLVFEGQVL